MSNRTPFATPEANVAGAFIDKGIAPNLKTRIEQKYGSTANRLAQANNEKNAMRPADILKMPLRPQRRKSILDKSMDGVLQANGTKDRSTLPDAQKRYERAEAFGQLVDEIVSKGYDNLSGTINVPDGAGGWVIMQKKQFVIEQATTMCAVLPDVAEFFKGGSKAEIEAAIEATVCKDANFAKNIYKAHENVIKEGRVVSSEARDKARERVNKATTELTAASTKISNVLQVLDDDPGNPHARPPRPAKIGLRHKVDEFDPPAAAPGTSAGPGSKLRELTDLMVSKPTRTASIKIYEAEEKRLVAESGRVTNGLNKAQQDLDSDTASKGTPDPAKEAIVKSWEAQQTAITKQLTDVITKKLPLDQEELKLGELTKQEGELRGKLALKEAELVDAQLDFSAKQVTDLTEKATLAQEEMNYASAQNALVEEFQQVFGEGASDTLIQKLESIDEIRQQELQKELLKLKSEDERAALQAVESIGVSGGRIDRDIVLRAVQSLSSGGTPEGQYMTRVRDRMLLLAKNRWVRENNGKAYSPEAEAADKARIDTTLSDGEFIKKMNEQHVKSLMQKSFKVHRLDKGTFAALASMPDVGLDRMRAALEANNDFMDYLRETKQGGILKDTGPAFWVKTLSTAGLYALIMALFSSKSVFNGF